MVQRALEDLNPRHQVLETCVLPTELRAHAVNWDLINPSLSYYTEGALLSTVCLPNQFFFARLPRFALRMPLSYLVDDALGVSRGEAGGD